MLGSFGRDARVLAWDLFNEPSNSGYLDASLPLLKAVFAWAREANPDQPLTAGLWNDHPLSNAVMLDQSDVVTFHDYDAPEKLAATAHTAKMRRTRWTACAARRTCAQASTGRHVGHSGAENVLAEAAYSSQSPGALRGVRSLCEVGSRP